MNNTTVPPALIAKLDTVGDDPVAMSELALEANLELCRRLLEGGAPGLHLYAMNTPEPAMTLVRELGLAPAEG